MVVVSHALWCVSFPSAAAEWFAHFRSVGSSPAAHMADPTKENVLLVWDYESRLSDALWSLCLEVCSLWTLQIWFQ